DGSNKIKRILEPSGRITSFTVDGSGDLTKWIRADGSRVTLGYTSHYPTKWYWPDGSRTTFTFSGDRVIAAYCPLIGRTSYTYTTQQNVVEGNDNYRTTLLFDTEENVTTVVNPLGLRTTLSWGNSYLATVQDPLHGGGGVLAQFDHTIQADGSQRITRIRAA